MTRNRIFGLDGGIASIGWAVIDVDDGAGRIVAAGSRIFDAPETAKERMPTNAVRRQKRGQRRVIRRKRQRMQALRSLLHDHGLIAKADRDAFLVPGLDPWTLRAEGLDRALAPQELAVALAHIAAHRGFRSNAKARASNAADETSKVLGGIQAMKDRLAGWRTVGEMLARDPAYATRKRNRDGDYARSVERADQEAEVSRLFAAQRRFGSRFATEDLASECAKIAFSQRALQDSEHLVGPCQLMQGERRTARKGRSYELFRLLSKLNTLTLTSGGSESRLTAEDLVLLTRDFGAKPKLSYKDVRKLLKLPDATRFLGITDEKEQQDVAAKAGAAEGTAALRKVLDPAEWRVLLTAPEQLDRIAEVLTFRSDLASIGAGLAEAGASDELWAVIVSAAENGKLACFSGAGHVSAAASRALLPHLLTGATYSDACKMAGFDHALRPLVKLHDIKNPVARKALGEMLKQVRAMIAAYGMPERIHVELARDVGRSAEERDKVTKGIEERTRIKDKRRDAAAEILGRTPSNEELLRYELWHEQNGFCLYSDEHIPPDGIRAGDQGFQIDHILPWSRFGDDSFVNKTLCTARANQAKRGRTPYEWFSAEKSDDDWSLFVRRVEGTPMKRYKKVGHYLRKNAAEVEEGFKSRNLGDTRYGTRLLLDMLARLYPHDGSKHVLARPGRLTARLRHAWGLDHLKRDASGKRLNDDRHHALDAIVLAATSNSLLLRVTQEFQAAENRGQARDFGNVAPPWPGFRDEAIAAWSKVFVSRADRRRARGEAHKSTIRQVRERDGKQILFERKAVESLTEADLARVKDADRNTALIEVLRKWLADGKPKDRPPLSYKSNPGTHERDVIRKVRLCSSEKFAVPIRSGTGASHRISSANRGDMVRVDVFRGPDRRGNLGYHLVPVYPHHVAEKAPPNRACGIKRSEENWMLMGPQHQFLFSLYSNSLVHVRENGATEAIMGYFGAFDRDSANFKIFSPCSKQILLKKVAAGSTAYFCKLEVSRLGIITQIKSEARTWHGVACT